MVSRAGFEPAHPPPEDGALSPELPRDAPRDALRSMGTAGRPVTLCGVASSRRLSPPGTGQHPTTVQPNRREPSRHGRTRTRTRALRRRPLYPLSYMPLSEHPESDRLGRRIRPARSTTPTCSGEYPRQELNPDLSIRSAASSSVGPRRFGDTARIRTGVRGVAARYLSTRSQRH